MHVMQSRVYYLLREAGCFVSFGVGQDNKKRLFIF